MISPYISLSKIFDMSGNKKKLDDKLEKRYIRKTYLS